MPNVKPVPDGMHTVTPHLVRPPLVGGDARARRDAGRDTAGDAIGGIVILEADDIDHAVELMSKHPGVRFGPFEIRPAADLSGMIRESERRRSGPKT